MRIRRQKPCAAATLPALVWAAAATAQPEPPAAALDFDRPGLALVLRSLDSAATDARVARLLALRVPAGQTASPFLEPGPFEAAFRGAIELDLNDWYRFSVRGSGTVQLSIGGKVVIERQELPAGGAPLATDGDVRLSKGVNPIELAYRSPAAGDASLRLTWGNDYSPEEPLPPELLRHADAPVLELGLARRAGRDLVANSMCVRCHAASKAPDAPLDGVNGMPELQATAPDLAGIGLLLQPQWIEQWMLEPKALRPRARMPKVLSTDAAEARRQAADLVAYLIAAGGGGDREAAVSGTLQGNAERGRQLADQLRCRSCHSLPGGERPPPAAPVHELSGRASTWVAGGSAVPGHPRYDLDSAQVEAIERFLAEDAASLSRAVPTEFAERRMHLDGCLSCHGRDGLPGVRLPPSGNTPPTTVEGTAVEDEDAAEDTAQDYFAASADDDTGPGRLPPDLTWTGEKFRSDWLGGFVAGRSDPSGDHPRPHPGVHVPVLAAFASSLAAGLHHQHGLPASGPDDEPVDSELAAIGRDLVQGDRLGCHSCHPLGEAPALGGEGTELAINFALVRKRLRRAYFDRFLRDPQRILQGTRMPRFVDEDGYTALHDVFDGVASRQFEAIWHYLGTLDPGTLD